MNDTNHKRRIVVLMLGPALDVQGGIASVERLLLSNWTNHRYALVHIPTHRDGNRAQKLLISIKSILQFIWSIVTLHPKIIHIHLSSYASFYRKSLFILISRLFDFYIVVQTHSGRFRSFYSDDSGGLQKRYIRFILNQADRLLVLGSEFSDFYSTMYSRSVPAIIYNPISMPEIEPGEKNGRKIILALGRLGRNKGTYDLLAAFPSILKACPDAELWLGGDGEVEEVRKQVHDKFWAEKVRLLGWITGPELESAFRQASVFALPSYSEALPVSLLEAMSYAIPVVTTPVGSIPELVRDGENGALVRPGDVPSMAGRIAQICLDAHLQSRLGSCARETVSQRFEVSKIVNQLCLIYDGLLE